MKARIITAGLGIPFLVFVVLSPEPLVIRLFSSALALALSIEFLHAEKKLTHPLLLPLATICSLLPLILRIPPLVILPLSLVWLLFLSTGPLLRPKNPFLFCFLALFFWLATPCTLLPHIRELDITPDSFWKLQQGSLLLLIFVTQWSADTAGMIGGMLFGKHPFAPSISPRKTWEGALANAIIAILIALTGATLLNQKPLTGIAIGAIVAVFGQGGDLFQSAWKRQLGIKDSGALLPGHGGFLDRFDSLLASIPPLTIALSLLCARS